MPCMHMSADYLTVVSTKQTGEEEEEQPPQKPENEGENIPAEKTLDSIKIVNPPVKTVYTEGEAFAGGNEGHGKMERWHRK